MKNVKLSLTLWVVIALLAAGCQPSVKAPESTLSATSTQPAALVIDTPSPFATLTHTPTLLPPTLTNTPTITLTPTPTPNPMSIQALRAGTYPGSDIVIENELAPGSGYHRYYASYLSEGLKIYALLTVPDAKMPDGGWPALVFNHGFIPPKQYRTTERYIAYVDDLARAGYIVFRIDYRGNGSSEGIAHGAYGDPGYTVDVLNAIASIKRYPQVNPQKIGMWGHSMGGFLTLRAMVISKDIKVGVIWSGVVGSYDDIINHWHRSASIPTTQPGAPNWRLSWLDTYGTPEQNPDFWNSLSANAYLADLSAPLQLHHDTSDSEVPYAFSATLANQLKALGKEGELYSYPGDDHNLANSFGQAMTRTIQFYDKYLK
jgi:dipeptidyl aminopeptidase/acylaminoacyl peptidase